MNKKENFDGVIAEVTHQGRQLEIYWGEPGFTLRPYFTKSEVPALIAFIQQWLDHDPERELVEKINELRDEPSLQRFSKTPDIIAAVREHDRKYGT